MECKVCGKPLEAKRNTKRYCSSACKQQGYLEAKFLRVKTVNTSNVTQMISIEEAVEVLNWFSAEHRDEWLSADNPMTIEKLLSILFIKSEKRVINDGQKFLVVPGNPFTNY